MIHPSAGERLVKFAVRKDQQDKLLLIDLHHGADLLGLECTVEAELARGNPRLAEQEARELVRLAPLRETGYRLLMRALAAGGKVAEVPLVLAQCSKYLADHAAIEPSPDTYWLYDDLVAR